MFEVNGLKFKERNYSFNFNAKCLNDTHVYFFNINIFSSNQVKVDSINLHFIFIVTFNNLLVHLAYFYCQALFRRFHSDL